METIITPVRGCGRRANYGMYIVGETASAEGILPLVTLLTPPVPYDSPVHRTPRIVDGTAILERAPQEEWFVGNSAETERRKAAIVSQADMFGMPLKTRVAIGVCAGASNAEEAMAMLIDAISITSISMLKKAIRTVAMSTLQTDKETTKAATLFNDTVTRFFTTGNMSYAVQITALCWLMAKHSKKNVNILMIANVLKAIGLYEDATAMIKQFVKLSKI